MSTKNKSEIIVAAENALKSIQDWRKRGSDLAPANNDIGRTLINLSLLPALNKELLQSAMSSAIESDGEIPLALHAVSCLNFIGGGEEAHIAKITGKSKRWKRFSQEELPSVLDLFAEQSIRVAMGFCISDLGDFIDNTQQDKDNIEQNVTAMRRDLDQAQKNLKEKWGKNSPEIRVFRHRDVFEDGPVGATFDQMFASNDITHDDVASLRLWLLEKTVSPETDPFLIHAPEDGALFQIFASGVLYAADIATSPAVMQAQFPAEEIKNTVMLNLFPDYKADAVIQRVFTEILVPEGRQTAVISPFANAGRWESDPVDLRLPAVKKKQEHNDTPVNPKNVFIAIISAPDAIFSSSDIMERKLNVAQHGISALFDKESADKCRREFEAVKQARGGLESVELPSFQVTNGEQLAVVIARMRKVSNSEARRIIAGKGVKINGNTVLVNDMETAGNFLIPPDARVISIGKRDAWTISKT